MTEESSAKTRYGAAGGGVECETGMAALFVDGIPKFSGDDKTISSAKWAQDLEDNAEILKWSAQQKLIIARRTLVGTAALWLKGEKAFKTYELKVAVQKEFPETVNVKEMHEIMAARKKQKDETYYQYMLVMKELGRRAKFPDYVPVQYIIDGIQDFESNKAILYGATTYPVLKEKLLLYEKMKSKRTPHKSTEGSSGKWKAVKQKSQRCYNCGETDHVASACSNGIKCFRCNKYGHIGSHCTEGASSSQSGAVTSATTSVKQSKTSKGASTSSGDAVVGRSVKQKSNVNMAAHQDYGQDTCQDDICENDVSMTVALSNRNNKNKPMKEVTANQLTFDALVNSGSDVNLITQQCCVAISVEPTGDELTFSGLGHSLVKSLGKVSINVTIDHIEYTSVLFHVVDKSVMPFNMILGQDLLKHVTMIMSENKVMLLPKRDEWMCMISCFSDNYGG